MRKSISTAAGVGLAALVALGAAPAWSAFQDENLLTVIPNGFKIGKQGETVLDWTRMITVQVFRNIKRGDPNQFAQGVRAMWLSACPGSEVIKIKDGAENGYPFAVWQFTCPNNPQTGKPENMYTKVIGANDALYSVQYAYRSELTKDVIPPTMAYLGSVRVCDTRLPDRPCPTTSP